MVKIKDIPKEERPVERLITKGPSNLSTEELIAILIKTGTKKKSSKELATEILKETKSVDGMKNINMSILTKIDGIGIFKASILLAAIELGKRVNSVNKTLYNQKITSSSQIYDYYKNIIGNKEQEYFCCLYLNNNKILIKDKVLFIGTLNYSMVHPREVFKEAYLVGATSIICLHNHPTGNINPSKKDIELTNDLIQIGKIHDIHIDDHIIVSKGNKKISFFIIFYE